MKKVVYMILACVLCLSAIYLHSDMSKAADSSSLIVYPEYDERIPKCYDYGVTVHQGNRSEKLHVYNRNANGEQMSNRCFKPDFNRRFCEFAFTGEVRIDIEVYSDFSTYSILPSSKAYRNEYHDGIISVWLDENDTNFMLRLDDEDATILSVFADAPEDYQFDKNDSSVLYVDEKWYDPNGSELIYNVPENIKTIYIAPGCVLYSRLLIKTNDVTVCGHGMIVDPYGDYYDTQSIGVDNDKMVIRVEGSHVTIRDIKLVDTQNFNIYLFSGYYHNIYDVKILTARITTDAVAVGSGNVTIDNCVFYVSDNVFTYNGDRGYHHIKNCLVGTTCAAFFPQHQSLYDIDFTDIYVFRANEGIVNNWFNPTRKQSEIKHITFNNLDCVDMVHTPWIFHAHDMGDAEKWFTFNNCHFANIRGDSNIKSWNQTENQSIYVDNSGKYEIHCSGYKIDFVNCTLDGKVITDVADLNPQLTDGDEISFNIQYDNTDERKFNTKNRVNHVYDKKVYINDYLQPLKSQPLKKDGIIYLPEREICRALEIRANEETSGIIENKVKYVSLEMIQKYYTNASYDNDKKAICLSAIPHIKSNIVSDYTYTSRWNPCAYPNVILGPYVDTNNEVVLRCDVNSTIYYPGMFANITDDLRKHGAGKYTISFDAKSTDGKSYAGRIMMHNIQYDGYSEVDRVQNDTFTVTGSYEHFEIEMDLSKWDTSAKSLSFIRICSLNTPGYDVLFKNIKMIKTDATKEPYYEDDSILEVRNGFVEENGKTYYFVDDVKQVGWIKIDNLWYYFEEDGVMETGWEMISGKWYYFTVSGAMTTGWKQVSNKWYYFGTSGAMVTGWKLIADKWYYFGASGAMATGWRQIAEKWYYFGASGAMATGWKLIADKWYYFGASGAMVTGWKLIADKWYYFGTSGAMVTGWKLIADKWYYFETSGRMITGWLKLDEKWYYFKTNGAMVTGTYVIDGKEYLFDKSGAWLR